MSSRTAQNVLLKHENFMKTNWEDILYLRDQQQWAELLSRFKPQIMEFQNLPESLKSKIDQFLRYSYQFFIVEAQYHEQQSITKSDIGDFEGMNKKIMQLKARTYFFMYKQSHKLEYIQKALEIAKDTFGPKEKITQKYQKHYDKLQQSIEFEKLQKIPDFEAFRAQIEPKYSIQRQNNNHMEAIERMATQASTLESKIIQKTNQSLTLFLTRSLIQNNKTTSYNQIRQCEEQFSQVDIQPQGYLVQLSQRPKTAKRKIIAAKHQTLITVTNVASHKKMPSNVAVQNAQEQRLSAKLRQSMLLKRSSRINHNNSSTPQPPLIQKQDKYVQVEFSNPMSIASPKSLSSESKMSTDSLISFKSTLIDISHQGTDLETIADKLQKYDQLIKRKSARIIWKQYKIYKDLKLSRKSSQQQKPKTNFAKFANDIGANVPINEKIFRTKAIIALCIMLDSLKLKSWVTYQTIPQQSVYEWSLKNIRYFIFQRIKTKKNDQRRGEEKHQDIIQQSRLYPQYRHIIRIFTSGVDGTTAVMILSFSIEIKGKIYDLRIHIKNLQNFFKEEYSSENVIFKLLQYYFKSNQLPSQHFVATQCLVNPTATYQENKSAQFTSHYLAQLINSQFYIQRAMNGQKIRRIYGAEYLIENRIKCIANLQKRAADLKKVSRNKQILHPQIEMKKSRQTKKQPLLKSQTLFIEEKPTTPKRNHQPMWLIRSSTYNEDDKYNELDEIIEAPGKTRMTQSLDSSCYFRDQGREQEVVQKNSLPLNEFQQQYHINLFNECLLVYLERPRIVNAIHFHVKDQQGEFQISTYNLNQKKPIVQVLPMQDLANTYGINWKTIDYSLRMFHKFQYQTKITILNQINQRPSNIDYKKVVEQVYPEFVEKKRLFRQSQVSQGPTHDLSMEHFYIFTLHTINKPQSFFSLRPTSKGWQLYVYQMFQPTYIQIISQAYLLKIQKLFKSIIVDTIRKPKFQIELLKKSLLQYIKSRQTSIGRCRYLGFQQDNKNKFTYQLQSVASQSIYGTIFKAFLSSQQDGLVNIIRTFCKKEQYSLVSTIQNLKGKNLILFTQIIMKDIYFLEIRVYPYNSRSRIYKTYLNHLDLQTFGIQDKSLEQKAYFLKNCLALHYNLIQRQIHLKTEDNFIYVNKIQTHTLKQQYIKQKKTLFHIYKKIKKIKGQYLIISVLINIVDWRITFLIYIPLLCKQFRCNMTFDDFHSIDSQTLEGILSQEQFQSVIHATQQKYRTFLEELIHEKDKCSEASVEYVSQSKIVEVSPVKQRIHKSQTMLAKFQNSPHRVSSDFRIFKENFKSHKRIIKEFHYDYQQLIYYLKEAVQNGNERQNFGQLYFWDQILEVSTIHINSSNKYILQIDNFRGIIRQLVCHDRVCIRNEEFLLETFFEQSQVEYGSMFEKYSFVSLKESQQTQIYFQLKSQNNRNFKFDLRCQFRQCIYNFSKLNQISYSEAIHVLKSTSQMIAEQIGNQQKVIDFPNIDLKSIVSFRTNKKTLSDRYRIRTHTQYKFIFQTKLIFQVLLTILLKKKTFYFHMEDASSQQSHTHRMTLRQVEMNLPYIQILLDHPVGDLGERLLKTYKNNLIVIAYQNLYQ